MINVENSSEKEWFHILTIETEKKSGAFEIDDANIHTQE